MGDECSESGEVGFYPFLIRSGRPAEGKPLHVLAGIDREHKRIFIITVYVPDAGKWSNNFIRRKQ
jgi:hypothetical protein